MMFCLSECVKCVFYCCDVLFMIGGLHLLVIMFGGSRLSVFCAGVLCGVVYGCCVTASSQNGHTVSRHFITS